MRRSYMVRIAALAIILAVALTPLCAVAGAAVPRKKIIIKVYPDASVKFIGNLTVPNASLKGNATIKALFNVSVLKKGFIASVTFNMSGRPRAGNVTASVKGVKGLNQKLALNLTLRFNGTSHITSDVAKTLTSIKMSMTSAGMSSLSISLDTVKPLNSTIIRKGLVNEFSGTIKIGFKGKNAVMFAIVLSLLNKNYVEKQLRRNNVTWIKIKELKTSTTPSGAVIRFDEVINYSKMLEELSKRNVSKTAIEHMRKGFEAFFTPQNMAYGGMLRMEVNTSKYSKVWFNGFLKSDIKPLEEVNVILKSAPVFISIFSARGLMTGLKGAMNSAANAKIKEELSSVERYLNVLSKVMSEFELLPSNGYLMIKAGKGGTIISFETPKIRAKGAKSPTDTLEALSKAVINLSNYVLRNETKARKSAVSKAIKELVGSKAVLVGVKGVRVSKREVPLTKLGAVKVIVLKVTTPLTTSKGQTIRTVVGTKKMTTTVIMTSSSTTSLTPKTTSKLVSSTSTYSTTTAVTSRSTSSTTTMTSSTTSKSLTSTSKTTRATPSTPSTSTTSTSTSMTTSSASSVTTKPSAASPALIAGVSVAIAVAIGVGVALALRRRH